MILRTYFTHLMSAAALVGCWLVIVILVRQLHLEWCEYRAVRRALWILPSITLAFLVFWTAGTWLDWPWLVRIGATTTAIILAISLALTVALPFSGAILVLQGLIDWAQRKAGSPPPVDTSRRKLIGRAVAVLPATTVMAAGYAVGTSYGPINVPEVPLSFPDLHSDLEGFRILHLSDFHLGHYHNLNDLECMMEQVSNTGYDLVLVTGDIADDLDLLPQALRTIDALKPRYGVYASLGNYEYYQGIKRVHKIIDAGPIPLLKDQGTTIQVGNAELYLSGADDPVWALPAGNRDTVIRDSIVKAIDGAPSDAFHVVMSHRPEGFDIAARLKLQLTLAGHTHGSQIGWNGRSLLEPLKFKKYLWGHYRNGSSQLYTSAGLGEWFPFRLNCPHEAPVYVLGKDIGYRT